jgi:hypothetical protein
MKSDCKQVQSWNAFNPASQGIAARSFASLAASHDFSVAFAIGKMHSSAGCFGIQNPAGDTGTVILRGTHE